MPTNEELTKRNKTLERRWKIFLALAILFLVTRPLALFIVDKFKNSAVDQATKDALTNKYPLLDPVLPFYNKEDLIVNVQELRGYLRGLPEQNKDWAEMSIYFEVLNTGANISVNPDTTILPASLMKLPVGMIAMKKVEKGEWTTSTEFSATAEDMNVTDTSISRDNIGKNLSLQLLLEKMLLESDSAAYNILVRQYTREELFSLPEAVGLDEAFIANRKISAKEYTRMLRALYSATFINEEHSQMLLDLLARSNNQNFLRAGIPAEVNFAHKWGTNLPENVYSDSGIVYLDKRPYLISVMVAGKGGGTGTDRTKAEQLMKEIGRVTYDFVKKQ